MPPSRKNKRKIKNKNKLAHKPTLITPTKSKVERIIDFFKKPVVLVISGVFIFLGWIVISHDFGDIVHEHITSPEELYKEKNYEHGILIPAHIFKSYDTINFVFGGGANICLVPMNVIKEGTPFDLNCFSFNGGQAFNLQSKLVDGLLYFSASFYDLDGLYVGKMDFEQWELRKDKITYYPSSNNSYLEIHDDRNLIMFQMQYLYPNTISFNGYFVDPLKNIVVFSNGMNINNTIYGTTESENMLRQIKSLSEKN